MKHLDGITVSLRPPGSNSDKVWEKLERGRDRVWACFTYQTNEQPHEVVVSFSENVDLHGAQAVQIAIKIGKRQSNNDIISLKHTVIAAKEVAGRAKIISHLQGRRTRFLQADINGQWPILLKPYSSDIMPEMSGPPGNQVPRGAIMVTVKLGTTAPRGGFQRLLNEHGKAYVFEFHPRPMPADGLAAFTIAGTSTIRPEMREVNREAAISAAENGIAGLDDGAASPLQQAGHERTDSPAGDQEAATVNGAAMEQARGSPGDAVASRRQHAGQKRANGPAEDHEAPVVVREAIEEASGSADDAAASPPRRGDDRGMDRLAVDSAVARVAGAAVEQAGAGRGDAAPSPPQNVGRKRTRNPAVCGAAPAALEVVEEQARGSDGGGDAASPLRSGGDRGTQRPAAGTQAIDVIEISSDDEPEPPPKKPRRPQARQNPSVATLNLQGPVATNSMLE